MHLKIAQRAAGKATILELDGRVTLGAEADELYAQARKLIDAGRPNLILHIEKVIRIDSAGWGTVMRAVQSARTAGGDLRLLKPSKATREVLELLGLAARPEILRVFVDEQEAVESFTSR